MYFRDVDRHGKDQEKEFKKKSVLTSKNKSQQPESETENAIDAKKNL